MNYLQFFCNFAKQIKYDNVILTVDDGAILDLQFSHFYHEPPDGFEQIMVEKSLL